uniref:Sorting nexin-1 n=1 Tax=Oreochromis niloticus TaxID=8128 RepID=A0A669B1R3_ORENI
MDTTLTSDVSMKPPSDIMNDPLIEPMSSQTENKPASEPSDDFFDLTNNVSVVAAAATKSDDFVDILGSETGAQRGEVVKADVTVEATIDKSEVTAGITDPLSQQEAKQTSTAPVIDLSGDSQPVTSKIANPLVDLFSDAPPAAEAKKPSSANVDLFDDEEGSDIFAEPLQTKPAKQLQKSLFVTAGGPLQDSKPANIFSQAAASTPSVTSTVNSKSNGVHSEEEGDIFAEATVELSLDSPRNERKKEAIAKPSAPTPTSLPAAASLTKPQPPLEEEEEEEEEDKFDIFVSVKDPEKIGDGMNAYMAYKVSTQTTLPMFRNKTFTVRRRFSDFLGLYEKLSEKHGPNGFIVPPPPEKSLLGMTKVKVGKEDSSSTDFVERRRGALERYLQRVVNHPSLLQDPDVREFLEREELPRAVSTQALSGAGFLKMINKATDAVSKMTIKMNESDVWFEEKLQEVESADQQFRKLHALVESLVVHRKELSLNTASFAKSAAMLGSAEDNTALSRALSQLAEVEDKMEQLHQEQAANDTFTFAEMIADYIRLLGAVRGSFDHRMKAWQRWQDAQSMLQKKRETEAKLLWANKPDKLQLAKEEIAEWEAKVTQYERDFERVSATVRKEVIRFEREKTKNCKRQIIKYLECLLQSQQQLIKYWEAFLPEAKAIA